MTAPAPRFPVSFLVIGEALVDVVPGAEGEPRDLPGGSPANVAITLGRLDRTVRLVTTLGRDARGDAVRAWLEASNVEVRASVPASGRTSSAAVTLDASGAATYEFDLAWDLTWDSSQDLGGIAPAVIHVGSVATILDPGAEAVGRTVRALRGSSVVSFDPNARPALTPDREDAVARVEELVALSDVVKVSDEDLGWYHPDREPAEVASAWAATGPGVVVVTRGGAGATVVRPDGRSWDVSGMQVEVADTVGAGDTFTGVLLDALAELGVHGPEGRRRLREVDDGDLTSAVRSAAAGAAVTVSRPGSDPPTRADLQAILETLPDVVAARPPRSSTT